MRIRLLSCVILFGAAVAYSQTPEKPATVTTSGTRNTVTTMMGGGGATARMRWEYQVLTKAEIAKLGNGDFGAGLSKLGDEAWEMVALGTTTHVANPEYYFKRAKGHAPAGGMGMMGGGQAGPNPGAFQTGGFAQGGFQAGGAPMQPRVKEVVKIMSLKFAKAPDLRKILQELYGAGPFGPVPQLRITSDERTNSLIVVASEEQLTAVEAIVMRLDQDAGNERPKP